MRKKVGILGGTFDPFHNGHFMLAKTAYSQFGLDEVWIMPNGNPPHKRNIEQTDFEIRCEMIRIAIKDAPYMVLCDYEGSEDSYHFTYQTLGEFKQLYPDNDFYFIIGADSLRDFPTWREPGIIAKLCTLLVACRDESGFEDLEAKIVEMKERYDTDCLIMNSPKVDAASSEIRKFASEGQNVSCYVGDEVWEYMKSKKLYGII
jgi:nicotinate-nucleotide adenylyltransferase